MKTKLQRPIMLREASRELGISYQRLRQAAMRGLVPAEQLNGWFWFVDLEPARQFAVALRRRTAHARKS